MIEVLMAILIMSIGVVSVATMFPLSMVRSIQATQLTSATILRFNAEARIDADKRIYVQPDPKRVLDITKTPKYFVDPYGYFLMRETGGVTLAETLGNDGAATPAPVGKSRRFHGIQRIKDWNDDGTTPAESDITDGLIEADRLCMLPDSWNAVTEGLVTATATDRKSVTLDTTVDLSNISIFSPAAATPLLGARSRAILLDVTGQQSQVRELTGVDNAAHTLFWNDRLPDRLGTTANPGQPAFARIETQNRNYTWMLTVRRQPRGNADIDVVIFFKRSGAVKDEQAYGNTNPADDEPLSVFTANSAAATVKLPTADRPWLQKGGWVLDLQNARWHRIQNYTEISNASGNTWATLTLDQPATGNGTWAVFMRGVVDVYPIGTKSP